MQAWSRRRAPAVTLRHKGKCSEDAGAEGMGGAGALRLENAWKNPVHPAPSVFVLSSPDASEFHRRLFNCCRFSRAHVEPPHETLERRT